MTFVEEEVQDRVNAWKWIDSFGIPPGPAATEMARSGTVYALRWASDVHAAKIADAIPGADKPMPLAESLDSAERVLNSGTPVPLLVGDSAGWIPQHYVLAVGYSDGKFTVYDPAYGTADTITKDELMTSDVKRSQLGYCSRVYATYLPPQAG